MYSIKLHDFRLPNLTTGYITYVKQQIPQWINYKQFVYKSARSIGQCYLVVCGCARRRYKMIKFGIPKPCNLIDYIDFTYI